jgi:signal transduction histidine kinase
VHHIVGAAVGAVMTLSIALRGQLPMRTWTIATCGAAVLLASHVEVGPFGPQGTTASVLLLLTPPLVALYTVARTDQANGRFAVVASVLAFGPLLLADTLWVDAERTAVLAAGVLVTAWALGETVRTRGEAAAVRLAAQDAEKSEHDRAVAAEERARIARELHDITAHHISVVTLQAGTARLMAEAGQAPSAELLSGIETASRQAMIEIRHALGVIRSSPGGAAPLPGMAQLQELTGRMALAGLTVTVDGSTGPLPGGLELTVYRIVQEGLTNVARHSAAHAALVTFLRGNGFLEITVADDGPPRLGPLVGPGGQGLIGLRERVNGAGGELRTAQRPGGGFELRAILPTGHAAVDRTPSHTTPSEARP